MTFSMTWAGQAGQFERTDVDVVSNTENEDMLGSLGEFLGIQVERVAADNPEAEVSFSAHGHADSSKRLACSVAVHVGTDTITNQQMRSERERKTAGQELKHHD